MISRADPPTRIGTSRATSRRRHTVRTSAPRPFTRCSGLFLAGLAAHAASGFWQEAEALRGDLLAAVLADSVPALGAAAHGVLSLLLVLFEQAAHALAGGAVALHLGHVGLPKSLAHSPNVDHERLHRRPARELSFVVPAVPTQRLDPGAHTLGLPPGERLARVPEAEPVDVHQLGVVFKSRNRPEHADVPVPVLAQHRQAHPGIRAHPAQVVA